MKKLCSIFTLSIILVILSLINCAPSPDTSWGWKRATTTDDMLNFLNSTAPYNQKIKRSEVTAVNKESYDDYIAFYQSGESGDALKSWGWKRATEVEDAWNFLNTTPPYTQVITNAEITAVNKGAYTDFIIFYQTGTTGDPHGGWGWKRATDSDDVMNFLNTTPPYTQIITRAEITAVNMGSYLDFIIFYQTGSSDDPHGGWGWKKSTDPDDVKAFLSGEGTYNTPVASAEIVAVKQATYDEFYVFYTR